MRFLKSFGKKSTRIWRNVHRKFEELKEQLTSSFDDKLGSLRDRKCGKIMA